MSAEVEAFLLSVRQVVRNRKVLVALLGLPLLAAAVAGAVFWQTSHALRESGAQIASESEIPFALLRPGEDAPATQSTGSDPSSALSAIPQSRGAFEWISTPALFTDAVELDGSLYVVGPAGVFEYDAQGALRQRYRAGQDLPSAALQNVAAGLALASVGRSVYITTAGEGLLILHPGTTAASPQATGGATATRARFQQVRAEDPVYRDLTAVLALPTGRILLGTEHKGVLVYDGKRLAPLHPNLSDFHVTALAGDESSLWIGTLDQGLLHWHAGRLQRFGETEGLPDRQVLALELEGNHLFAGTPLGVAEFADGRFERELAPGFFASSLLLRGDRLLIGTLDEGVVETPLEASRPRGPRLESKGRVGLEGIPVARLLEVTGAPFALACDGLYALDAKAGESSQVLQRSGAVLSDRNISALNVDASGRIWVGYFDRGLDIVEPALDHARHIENEHVFCINRIVESIAKGLTAVATANGLVMFDASGEQQQVLGRKEGLLADHVTDVWFGSSGMIAATPAGITFIDGAGSRSLYAFHGLVNNHVYTLAAAGERLLAGTLGGLSVLDAGVVRASYTTGNSELKHNWITSIVPLDHDWFVGTYGAGVLRLDEGGRWHSFPDAGRPLEINPNAMAASADRVYAGTLGEGLYIYERANGRWRVITRGLPSQNVTALELSGGYLYVGTDNGLVRVPENGL